MYVMEVENFGTGDTSPIQAENKQEMHKGLIDKGFDCMVKYQCYAGHDDKGNEIGVNILGCPTVHHLKAVNQDKEKEEA